MLLRPCFFIKFSTCASAYLSSLYDRTCRTRTSWARIWRILLKEQEPEESHNWGDTVKSAFCCAFDMIIWTSKWSNWDKLFGHDTLFLDDQQMSCFDSWIMHIYPAIPAQVRLMQQDHKHVLLVYSGAYGIQRSKLMLLHCWIKHSLPKMSMH